MVGRFISPTSSPPPPVPSSRQREVPLNNNFDRQIGVVHISAFDRYLAKLWALPAVSLRDGGEEQEEEEEKAAAEEEPSPAGLASRFRLGSTFELPLYPFFPPSFSVGIFLSAQPSPGFPVSSEFVTFATAKNSSTVRDLVAARRANFVQKPKEKNRNCTRQSTTTR